MLSSLLNEAEQSDSISASAYAGSFLDAGVVKIAVLFAVGAFVSVLAAGDGWVVRLLSSSATAVGFLTGVGSKGVISS